MGDQSFLEYFHRKEENSARRWHPAAAQLLRSAAGGGAFADQEGSRGADARAVLPAPAGEQVNGDDVVSARMRLLYDYRAPAGTRWSPTAEQLRELLALFHIGGVRTPTTAQISRITARLRAHGRIEGRNVFYWFQNQKARERKRRLQLLQNTSSSPQAPQQAADQAQALVHAHEVPGARPHCKRHCHQAAEHGAVAEELDDDTRVSLTRLCAGEDQLQQNRSSGDQNSTSSSSVGEYYYTSHEDLLNDAHAHSNNMGTSCSLRREEDVLSKQLQISPASDLHDSAALRNTELALRIPCMEALDRSGAAHTSVQALEDVEKSEVSDAEVTAHDVQCPAALDLPRYFACREAADQINTGSHDFDEIDSAAVLGIKPLQLFKDKSPLHAAAAWRREDAGLHSLRQAESQAVLPARTLPLFPLSPATSSSSSTQLINQAFHQHTVCPPSLIQHGHPFTLAFSSPSALSSSQQQYTPLDLQLAIGH